MKDWIRRIVAAWDRFLFDGCDPRIVPVIRIGYALLVLVQVGVAWVDAERWFTDAGILRTETAKQALAPYQGSVLYWLPSTEPVVRTCLAVLALHACLLLVGFWSRWQAAAIFVWLVSFQNRNAFITDGEDTVFRLFAFLMIFLPLDTYASISPPKRTAASASVNKRSAWGLRLMQFEMTAIYASTVVSKFQGETWRDGTALWYVSRMTDNFGRWIPSAWFDQYAVSAACSWGTLVVEAALPIALWFRRTRKWALLAGFALHLGIEVSMNLFLFEWIMMLGLLSFVVPSEWTRTQNANAGSTECS